MKPGPLSLQVNLTKSLNLTEPAVRMKSSRSHGLTCVYKVEARDLVARASMSIYSQMTHDSSRDEKDGSEGEEWQRDLSTEKLSGGGREKEIATDH